VVALWAGRRFTLTVCRRVPTYGLALLNGPRAISEDLNHFSIKGAAAAATVAWEAMKQRGVIPR